MTAIAVCGRVAIGEVTSAASQFTLMDYRHSIVRLLKVAQLSCRPRPCTKQLRGSLRMHASTAHLTLVLVSAVLSTMVEASEEFPTPLPSESIPSVATLPEHYPATWAFLDYSGNRFELRNVGSDAHEVKGELPARDA